MSRPDREPARILIVRPSALGDVCRSVPVAASLRRAFPDARIAWLVQAGFEDAVRCHPAVDTVLPFARRALSPLRSLGAIGRLWTFVRELRRHRFDLVVDAQGLARSGLIALATGARRRVGPANAREGAWLAYTRRVPVPPGRHAVDAMLDLAEGAGAPRVEDLRLVPPPEDVAGWARARRTLGDRLLVVLAPTARWRCKQWPPERFAALGARLAAAGRHVVLVGAPGEEATVAAARPAGVPRVEAATLLGPAAEPGGDATSAVDAAPAPSVVDLAGRTGVGLMMAVVASAEAVVACDSAALHMAAGLGVPSVALFGPTDPELVGPRGGRSVVLRRVEPDEEPIRYRRLRDDDRYLRRIDVDEVAAALDRLREHGGGPGADGPRDGEAAA